MEYISLSIITVIRRNGILAFKTKAGSPLYSKTKLPSINADTMRSNVALCWCGK